MNLKVLIAVLSVILVCLLSFVPYVHRMNTPTTPPATESTATSLPASSQASEPVSSQIASVPTSQPVTQPSTSQPETQAPTTQPETQMPTQAPTDPPSQPQTQPTTKPQESNPNYSNPKVAAFVEARMKTWTCPVKDAFGEVTGSRKFATSRGGGKRAHAGLDFVAPHGTKVYAITSGTVQRVAVFYQSTWAVEVVNDDGSILRYCEIATELKVGDYVQQGDIIGTIMRADGGTEMLHMEVYLGDEEGMLTQSGNRTYKYVDDSKYYVRRSDLLDPTFLKDLPQ